MFSISPDLSWTNGIKWIQRTQKAEIDLSSQIFLERENSDYRVKLSYRSLIPTWVENSLVIDQTRVWSNNFQNINFLSADFKVFWEKKGLSIHFTADYINNAVLFDSFSQPYQSPTAIFQSEWNLVKQLDLGFISSLHRITYLTINTERVLKPDFHLSGRFSTDFTLFSSKMHSNISLEYSFIPSFIVPSFNPLTGQFYNDQSDDKSGNILLIQPMVAFRVDQFNFYFSAENSLSRFLSRDLFYVKDYNLYDFRINFGIKWRLLD